LAALLEAIQLVLPNRSADWHDILYAALGALTDSLIPALFLKIRYVRKIS
jgi:VanZ family protein